MPPFNAWNASAKGFRYLGSIPLQIFVIEPFNNGACWCGAVVAIHMAVYPSQCIVCCQVSARMVALLTYATWQTPKSLFYIVRYHMTPFGLPFYSPFALLGGVSSDLHDWTTNLCAYRQAYTSIQEPHLRQESQNRFSQCTFQGGCKKILRNLYRLYEGTWTVI